MTKEQYDRWKDFALRMVNVVVSARKKSPSRFDVTSEIEDMFTCRFDHDWERIRDWDYTEPSDWNKTHWPHHAMSVNSHIDDRAEYIIPNYWSLNTDVQHEKARERFVDPVSICIRAGLDVAVRPSAGVCGYSAGDIRKMEKGAQIMFMNTIHEKPLRFENDMVALSEQLASHFQQNAIILELQERGVVEETLVVTP